MEQTADIIIKVAAVISALAVIGGFGWKIFKCASKMQEHMKENYMSTLRLTIMSEEMPIEERLEAGEKYVNLGGNGAVKCKYRQLQQSYEAELERGRCG